MIKTRPDYILILPWNLKDEILVTVGSTPGLDARFEGSPIRFDVERMRADLAALEAGGWLEHCDKGLSSDFRAILLKSKSGGTSGPESQYPSWDFSEYRRTPYVERLPYFRELMEQTKCPQGRMRILRLAAGASIGIHPDFGAAVGCLAFKQIRLHVPIVTNDRVRFFVGGEKTQRHDLCSLSPGVRKTWQSNGEAIAESGGDPG